MTLGLYTHIPFCLAKCNYCHFISFPYEPALASRYQKAVLAEIEAASFDATPSLKADTVYFGGGTPSLIPPDYLRDILTTFRQVIPIEEDGEISIEANPGTLSRENLEAYTKIGINRISLGAQSFADQELEAIGRMHNANMIFRSLQDLKSAGFQNINLDLMLGLPFQTAESWRKNLGIMAGLDIPHISVYMLDLDDPCPLSCLVANGSVSIPSDDLVSDLYLETIEFLSRQGYRQYEISNFARPGYACRHNLKYWERDPVIGFGLASHSFDGGKRWANKSKIEEYLESIEHGRSGVDWREEVGEVQALQETIFLGLRLTKGIDWTDLGHGFDGDTHAKYSKYFERLISQNLAESEEGRIRLTPSGMLVSNEIFQQFV